LLRHYKRKGSGFKRWEQLDPADDYLIYPENMGEDLSIDEVSLSKGEIYTFEDHCIITSMNFLWFFWLIFKILTH
jgi:hypothetical protein